MRRAPFLLWAWAASTCASTILGAGALHIQANLRVESGARTGIIREPKGSETQIQRLVSAQGLTIGLHQESRLSYAMGAGITNGIPSTLNATIEPDSDFWQHAYFGSADFSVNKDWGLVWFGRRTLIAATNSDDSTQRLALNEGELGLRWDGLRWAPLSLHRIAIYLPWGQEIDRVQPSNSNESGRSTQNGGLRHSLAFNAWGRWRLDSSAERTTRVFENPWFDVSNKKLKSALTLAISNWEFSTGLASVQRRFTVPRTSLHGCTNEAATPARTQPVRCQRYESAQTLSADARWVMSERSILSFSYEREKIVDQGTDWHQPLRSTYLAGFDFILRAPL